MGLFDIFAVLITLSALLAYLNFRFLKLPTVIGLMLLALLLSLILIGLGQVVPAIEAHALLVLKQIDFDKAMLHGMLGFLLFAGALHVDMGRLWNQKWSIGLLATVGTLISTFLVGGMAALIFRLLAMEVPWIYCLLFGALISPTDPIAVLAILKTLGVPKNLAMKITGESLFNDGVGVVMFVMLVAVAGLGEHGAEKGLAILSIKEVVGGALFGWVIGLIAYFMLKSVDRYEVEIMISLALVAGGYALANHWLLSGPIAMVVAGLLIGNHGRALAMSDTTREHLDTFWELVDEILNAVLFVLIGLEVMVLTFKGSYAVAGLLAIPAVLLARLIAVSAPVTVLRRFRDPTPHEIKVLTWGGLRGGISVALALSLKETLGSEDPDSYEVLLFMTYAVVVFSITIQGLTMGPLLRRLPLDGSDSPGPRPSRP